MAFLRNTWYVAAWSAELEDGPIGQKIIGEHVLLYRGEDERVIALGDTCPHRFAPLHKGKVFGDLIECPYHGLRYDPQGQCAHNPFDESVKPAAANVKSYSVVERDKIIWVWMGQKEQADPDKIPDYSWINDTKKYAFTSFAQMTQPLGYELVIDNLMDLSHAQFVHPNTVGNESMTAGTVETSSSPTQVRADRLNPDGEVPMLFVAGGAVSSGTRVDFWNDMRWDAPSCYYLQVGITPPGASRSTGDIIDSVHLLTPQDEDNTVYRYLMGRTFSRDKPEITTAIDDLVKIAFTEEDEPMIKSVQERMNGREFWEMNPVILKSDKPAVLVRRAMQALLKSQGKL